MNEKQEVLDTGSRAGMTIRWGKGRKRTILVRGFCFVPVQVCFLFFLKKNKRRYISGLDSRMCRELRFTNPYTTRQSPAPWSVLDQSFWLWLWFSPPFSKGAGGILFCLCFWFWLAIIINYIFFCRITIEPLIITI